MQVKEILGELVSLHETAIGRYWVPDVPAGDIIGSVMTSGGIFDEHVYKLACPWLTADAVVLDIGSNLGQMAMEFAKLVNTVHAFEAHPFLHEVMTMNFAENGFANIVPHLGAVWDSTDLELFYPNYNSNTFNCRGSFGIDPTADANTAKGVTVKSLTVDSLNLERVDFVKIDIQGADLRCMKGMRQTIEKFQPAIIFEYETAFAESKFGETLQDYLNFVDEIGYRVVVEQHSNYLIVPK
jgi:FkbM family methyltransferase